MLDVGCGTGSLAVLLARDGCTVTGVDPAGASLEVARSKDPGGKVTWTCGDAATARGLGADLAVMTGNVAQVFITDADWDRTLRAIRAALRPRGYVVFETRRPERRAWEEWRPMPLPSSCMSPAGLVGQRREVTRVDLPLVAFRYTYTFLADGQVVTSDSVLRFRTRDETEAALARHGYQVLEVRQAPDRPGREYVFIAQRTT